MMYHIRMNSSLGETYKSLAMNAEQCNFMIEKGAAEPCVCGSRVMIPGEGCTLTEEIPGTTWRSHWNFRAQ